MGKKQGLLCDELLYESDPALKKARALITLEEKNAKNIVVKRTIACAKQLLLFSHF